MFCFSSNKLLFQRLGLALLLPQLCMFVWALPPFASGIWKQTEPLMLAMFVFAALASIWLVIGMGKGWLVQQPSQPLWICLMLWVGWQLIATLSASAPWHSWFGPMQTGEGVAWHLSLLLVFMLAYPLWQVAAYRKILITFGFMSAGTEGFLHWLAQYLYDPERQNYIPEWRPQKWADYLAFTAAYLWIIAAPEIRTRKSLWIFMLTAATMALVLISSNRAGLFIISGSLLASLFLERRMPETLRRFFYPNRAWRMLAMLACLLPIPLIIASHRIGEYADPADTMSINNIINERNGSLNSRILLNAVTLATMHHEPRRWLTGEGWGGFSDALFKHALLGGVYVYHNGKRDPAWENVDRDAYHSHSEPLEALLSLGLPGLILWFAIPITILWYLPQRHFWLIAPFIVGIVLLKYLWFELPQLVPYHALALVALSSTQAAQRWPSISTSWIKNALACLVVVMGWTGWQQWQALRYGEKLATAIKSGVSAPYSVEWLADDIKRGGDRLAKSAIVYAGIVQTGNQFDHDMASWNNNFMLTWYDNFMTIAHGMAMSPDIGARNKELEYTLQYTLLTSLSDPAFDDLRHKATDSIKDTILNLCKVAPLRDDIATIFLLGLDNYTHHDIGQKVDILREILAAAPNHRGALWVLGHTLAQDKEFEDVGNEMIRHAIALGVERVYPVTDAELARYR